jgi:alginate O-acetyltransferase complex protein AlgI
MARPSVEAWVFMWFMVGAIFLGCKWLTLQRAKPHDRQTPIGRQCAYLFLWGGMDARAFLGTARTKKAFRIVLPQLTAAIGKIALGALLLFGVARHFQNGLAAGWTGMIGMVLIAHFGLFEVATIWWQMRGLTAPAIMNAPWKSALLSEFWGRRWNHAFQQLVVANLFRPFAHSFGVVRATLGTFFISGLIHELVISLPAGAGYGLPTAYFLLQGWGLIAQRTPVSGRCWFRNRLFTLFLVIVPAFGLFHSPFIRRVVIPFMQTIGAL